MPVSFGKNEVELWTRAGKSGGVSIGVHFGRDADKKDIAAIYKALKAILSLKYGK